jgi:hypothetical protein
VTATIVAVVRGLLLDGWPPATTIERMPPYSASVS